MGIKGFSKWVETHGVHTYIRNRQHYQKLVIDLNGVLHIAIRKANTREQFFKLVTTELNRTMKRLVAKEVAFFIDGAAPMAKLSTQISRRRVRPFTGKTLDPMWITPGTSLMDALEIHLREKYPDIHIDGCRNPGEGEMKLVRWLLKQPQGKIAVFGSDADLLLILSAAKPLVNISIVSKDKKGTYWVNLDKLWDKLPASREEIVLISLLLGNDYLPGVYGANYRILWKHYSKTLFRRGELCLANWIEYLEKINNDTPSNNAINGINNGDAQKYVQGLMWCFEMYSSGKCPDNSFIYTGGGPTLSALIEFFKSKPKLIPLKGTLSPFTVDEVLLLLIPRWGIEILPEYLRGVLNYQALEHWYPEECMECQIFRKEVSDMSKLHTETREYGSDMAKLNSKYKEHRLKIHPKAPPPITQIKAYLATAEPHE